LFSDELLINVLVVTLGGVRGDGEVGDAVVLQGFRDVAVESSGYNYVYVLEFFYADTTAA